jgi:hypothetical protein
LCSVTVAADSIKPAGLKKGEKRGRDINDDEDGPRSNKKAKGLFL